MGEGGAGGGRGGNMRRGCQLLTFFSVLSVLSVLLVIPLYSQDIPFQKEGHNDAAKGIAAAVNGVPIASNLLEVRTRQIASVSSYHGRIGDKELEEIKNKALEELIIEELVYQEAKGTGITIPEKEIDKRLKEIKKGYPSEDAFNKALSANNLELNGYKKLIEREQSIKKITEKLFGKPIKLSDKEVEEYFEKNREKFKEPENIRLRQILIKVPAYASKEQWEMGREKAKNMLAELKAGKDFSKMAKEFSDDPSKEKGGDMGFIHQGRLEPYIEDIAFSLKVGEISDVIQTIYGFHIIKLEEKKEAHYNPYSKVKEKLKKDLEEVAAEDKKKEWIKGLKGKADIKYYAPFEKKN